MQKSSLVSAGQATSVDVINTHTTSRLSRRGTISSTSVFGVLPSAVTPVAQFCLESMQGLKHTRNPRDAYLLDIRHSRQLVALEYSHTFLCHVQVERELRTRSRHQLRAPRAQRDIISHLVTLLLELRQARQHILHVIQVRSAFSALHHIRRRKTMTYEIASCQIERAMTHPLKPALSCRNWLKSIMSLSIASRMCMCRSSVQTLSASDRVAVLSSTPVCVWNLYLRVFHARSANLEPLPTRAHACVCVPETRTCMTSRPG